MKVIIAGSRSITNFNVVRRCIKESGFKITEVVCGMARGVDTLGWEYAIRNQIPVKEFPAHWDVHGTSAGYKRNRAMADYADALILVWDGRSKGSNHMYNLAMKKGLKVYRYNLETGKVDNLGG